MRRLNERRTKVLVQARRALKEKRKRAASEARNSDPLWRRWCRIKSQGRDPDPGRHVPVAKCWATFENFEQGVGRPHQPGLVLSRIFTAFGWRPGNTCWRPPLVKIVGVYTKGSPDSEARVAGLSKEEARELWHRLSNHPVPVIPCTTPDDWGGMGRKAEENGVSRGTYYVRISRGWSKEKAISTPVGPWGGQKKTGP